MKDKLFIDREIRARLDYEGDAFYASSCGASAAILWTRSPARRATGCRAKGGRALSDLNRQF